MKLEILFLLYSNKLSFWLNLWFIMLFSYIKANSLPFELSSLASLFYSDASDSRSDVSFLGTVTTP